MFGKCMGVIGGQVYQVWEVYWDIWDMKSFKSKIIANQKFCLTMLSTFEDLSFYELDRFYFHFWIPGKILSEILVRTIFGCLVTLKSISEVTEVGR